MITERQKFLLMILKVLQELADQVNGDGSMLAGGLAGRACQALRNSLSFFSQAREKIMPLPVSKEERRRLNGLFYPILSYPLNNPCDLVNDLQALVDSGFIEAVKRPRLTKRGKAFLDNFFSTASFAVRHALTNLRSLTDELLKEIDF